MELARSPSGCGTRPGLVVRTLLTVLLTTSAVLLLVHLPGSYGQVVTGPTLTWWVLTPAAAVASYLDFHVQVGSQRYPISLSEIPFLLGLLFAPPGQFLLAVLVAECLVLVVRSRQPLSLTLLSLALFATEVCLATFLVRQVAGGTRALNPVVWGSALGGTVLAILFGTVVVWLVVRSFGVRTDLRPFLVVATVTAMCNASLAVIAAVLLVEQAPALVPLLLVVTALFVAYRGYTGMTKRYRGWEALFRITQVTGMPRSPDAILGGVLDEARKLLRAESAVAVLLADGRSPSVLTSGQMTADDVTRWQDALPGESFRRVLVDGETLVLPRAVRDPLAREFLGLVGARDCMVAPIAGVSGVAGLVLVADRVGGLNSFEGHDAELFTALLAHAGMTLENGRLVEQLHAEVSAREYEALHDPLTGLPNRTLFNRTVEAALDGGEHGAVLLVDLDRFKEVNDTFGHQAGDRLLQVVARRLRAAVARAGGATSGGGAGSRGGSAGGGATSGGGAGDLVARLGGDEFAVLLTGHEDAAEAMRRAVELHGDLTGSAVLSGPVVEVGASIGVAVFPGDGLDLDTLLRRADLAMYAAKRGRGGAVRFEPRWEAAERRSAETPGVRRPAAVQESDPRG